MSKFFTMLTQIGEAKFANATALGSTVKLEKLAVGDGGGTLPTPNQTQTALVNEVRRDMLNTIKVDQENANWIICEQVLPEDVGGWTIREVGVYDQDGDLIAVGNFPETYKPALQEGSGRTQTIQVVLQVSASSSVELKIDPSIVLATREYVDDQDKEHENKMDPHPQYVLKGHVQYERYNASRDYTRGEMVSILDNSEVTNYWCNKTHQLDSPVNPIGDSSDTWREFPYRLSLGGLYQARLFFDGRLMLKEIVKVPMSGVLDYDPVISFQSINTIQPTVNDANVDGTRYLAAANWDSQKGKIYIRDILTNARPLPNDVSVTLAVEGRWA